MSIDQPTIEEVSLRLDKLDKNAKELAKQFQSIQTSLDAIYRDRDLLTDLANDIEKVRQLVIDNDKHNETLTKEVVKTVEKKTDLVQAEVAVSSQELKNTIAQKIVNGVHKVFKKEDAVLVKKPFWSRVFFWHKAILPTI